MKNLQNTILGLFLIFSTSLMAQLTITETHQDNTCANNNGCNAYIKVTVEDGAAPYTYDWTYHSIGSAYIHTIAGEDSIHIDYVNYYGDKYKVIVTDNVGTKDSLEIEIYNTATNPSLIPDFIYSNFAWDSLNDNCIGEIQGNTSGGTPPYKYKFVLNSNYNWWSGTDTIGLCVNTENENHDTILIEDAVGCRIEYESTKRTNFDYYTFNSRNGLCNGGMSVSGGSDAEYLWDTGETNSNFYQTVCPGYYTVTLTSPSRIGEYVKTLQVEAVFDEYYEFVDTLDATVETCILDNQLSTDSAFIFNYHFVNSDSVVTNWAIWDNGVADTINVGLNVTNSGNNLVYLDVICNSKTMNEINVKSFYGMFNATGVSVNEIQKNDFSLFPNPAKNDFTIKLDNNKDSYLQILDITGKVIYQKNFKKDLLVETTNFKSGIYFVRIENDNNIITEKIIVE